MPRAWLSAGLLGVAGAAILGCAAKQSVSLACVPKDVTVYVDGRRIEGAPEALKLSKDESHTIFFKGGGYQPQMAVFESRERDGERVLEPADLCSQLLLVEMQPEVKIEVEPQP